MKTKLLGLVTLMVLSITAVMAQTGKQEKFEVAGNCSMCKARIEGAAKSVGGVNFANWDQATKILEVKYDSTEVNIHKIHMAIAKAGHDTKMHKASNEAYDNLPGCCKYERLITEADNSQSHDGDKR